MAIYVTGDCHGDFYKLTNFIKRFNLDERDSIIVLGDMGLYWRNDQKDANAFIEMYEANYKTHIYFIDGNHENFELLNALPKSYNARIGECSTHIHHFRRGTVFMADNKKCLAIGGADSVDKYRRKEGLSWWPDETISDADISGISASHYDYVFTHCCPISVLNKNKVFLCQYDWLDEDALDHTSEEQLEKVKNMITFDHWYFGHYHTDKELEGGFRCLLNDFVEIGGSYDRS